MAFNDSSYIVNQGRVFIQERGFNLAATAGLRYIGDSDTVELTISQKTDDIKDSFTGKGLTVANPVVETDAVLKIQTLDMQLKNWADATWGDNSGSVAGATATGESIVMYNGCYVKLAHPGVSNVVVSGAVVLDTDYVVDNASQGILRVLTTSPAAPDGTPLTTTVTYDYATYNGKVEAFVLGQKFYTVVVAGINVAQGNQPVILTVRQVQLEMAKKFDFIAKKHMAFELSGKLLYDGLLPLASTAGDLSNFFSLVKG